MLLRRWRRFLPARRLLRLRFVAKRGEHPDELGPLRRFFRHAKCAERGKDGILILEQTPGVDVALIDIMMPDMDGYQTMSEIRKRPALADLPLIAVTAKAMKGDRQKCLDAGASDYIAKPVDIELLLALVRVWVARSREAAAAAAGPIAMEAAE